MRPHQLIPLFAVGQEPCRHRPAHGDPAEEGAAAAAGRRRAARHRSALAHADRRHRPPRHADRRRGRARHHRHARGARPQAQAGARAATTGRPTRWPARTTRGRIDLVFFHAERKFIERQLPDGSIRTVSGRIESYNDKKQMAHPDYIVAPEARADLPLLEPVYPLTAGLSGKVLLKAARQALERVPELPEWQDAAWLKQRGWPDASDGARPPAPARGAGRRLAGLAALAAARLRRAAGRASWRWPWCGRASSRSPAAASPATAASAPGSPTRCPSASPTRSARR